MARHLLAAAVLAITVSAPLQRFPTREYRGPLTALLQPAVTDRAVGPRR